MGKALEMDRVAPVLDFIKQDINQGNGATGWVDRAKRYSSDLDTNRLPPLVCPQINAIPTDRSRRIRTEGPARGTSRLRAQLQGR